MSDFFDNMLRGPKGRPDHPDFWKLSDILLRHDGPVTDPTTARIFSMEERINQEINHDVMTYVCAMRAKIYLGQLGVNPALNLVVLTAVSSAWLDAFLVGVEWQKAKQKETKDS